MESRMPFITNELIEYLERMVPDRHPTTFEGEFSLGKIAGKVELIRKLRQLLEDQVAMSLTGTIS